MVEGWVQEEGWALFVARVAHVLEDIESFSLQPAPAAPADRQSEAAALDYDVVLMDINMPIMTGSEAAEQIRRLEASGDLCQTTRCHLSIVGMSATDGEQVPKFLDRGMDDFLIFPIDREILLQKVQNCIAHARAERELLGQLRLEHVRRQRAADAQLLRDEDVVRVVPPSVEFEHVAVAVDGELLEQ